MLPAFSLFTKNQNTTTTTRIKTMDNKKQTKDNPTCGCALCHSHVQKESTIVLVVCAECATRVQCAGCGHLITTEDRNILYSPDEHNIKTFCLKCFIKELRHREAEENKQSKTAEKTKGVK